MRRIAITACPYSATAFTVRVLCNTGLDIGHEEYGDDGTVSWGHIHMTKAEFIEDGFSQDMTLLHQLAHPLMVISRLRALHNGSPWPRTKEHIWKRIIDRTKLMNTDWDIENETPPSAKLDNLDLWMKLWYWWNKEGAAKADGVYRVEEIEDRWGWFCEILGLGDVRCKYRNKHINRKKTRIMKSWDDLYAIDPDLTLKILELAEGFGYTQMPVDYLDDPFYEFPERIELSGVTV